MFALLRSWLRRRRLERTRIPASTWRAAMAALPLADRLNPTERERIWS